MALGEPKELTDCRRFFQQPQLPRHRMYEALRAYFLEHRPSAEVARTFGYSPGSFRVLCHQFRRDPDPQFFQPFPPRTQEPAQEVPGPPAHRRPAQAELLGL